MRKYRVISFGVSWMDSHVNSSDPQSPSGMLLCLCHVPAHKHTSHPLSIWGPYLPQHTHMRRLFSAWSPDQSTSPLPFPTHAHEEAETQNPPVASYQVCVCIWHPLINSWSPKTNTKTLVHFTICFLFLLASAYHSFTQISFQYYV